METLSNKNIEIATSMPLFVKSQKEAKKIIRIESVDDTSVHIRKLNKKQYERKVRPMN
jgi:hypothetical protein